MTATMDRRRSDHERHDSTSMEGRQESLCLSEFVDEILQNDADILEEADDFMNLLPFGGSGGTLNAFDGDDIELVFELLGDPESSPENGDTVVDIESVDSSEDLSLPGRTTTGTETPCSEGETKTQNRSGCARTAGIKPHHYGEMKLRLRASAEAASHRKRHLNSLISDDEATNLEGCTDTQESTTVDQSSSPIKSTASNSDSTFSSAGEQLKKHKRGRSKSVHKRHRRRILDTPPSSPVRWNGAHAPTTPEKQKGTPDATQSPTCSESAVGSKKKVEPEVKTKSVLSEARKAGVNDCVVNTDVTKTGSTPTDSSTSSKLRFDGTLVSSAKDVKPKQKVIPLSLVEKLKAAAQKATARQSILLPVPIPKAAEATVVALDHDYCFQQSSSQAESDNLNPEPMDVVESDEEESIARIEVLPDLSLARRNLEHTVEVVVRPTNSRSLLKVNQPSTVQVVQMVTSGVRCSEHTVMMGQVAYRCEAGGREDSMEQMLGFVEEEEVVTTTPSETASFSDSGVESIDRRRESTEHGEEIESDTGDRQDGREGRRWKGERGRHGRAGQRDTNNNNNNRNAGGSGSDSYPYRIRRRRSGSATSNSSFSSSSESGRSRSGSSDCRCSCRNRSTQDKHYGQRESRKRSLSRERGCNRCRYPSPDYTVGSHASRRRAIGDMEREAYTAAGWDVDTQKEQRKPVNKRERKNIWCMDSEPSATGTPPAPKRQSQSLTAMQEALEKIRRGGDRKIIYVGKVPEGTTRVQIREWFSRFGPIAEVSLHFRDAGENYGFVTFERAEDAYTAVERGNDDPELPMFQLCFGGRRQFCGQQWSDLDSQPEKDYLRVGAKNSMKNEEDDDFDSLLKSLKTAPPSGARRA